MAEVVHTIAIIRFLSPPPFWLSSLRLLPVLCAYQYLSSCEVSATSTTLFTWEVGERGMLGKVQRMGRGNWDLLIKSPLLDRHDAERTRNLHDVQERIIWNSRHPALRLRKGGEVCISQWRRE
jgi:hypothetical protein